MKIPQNRTRENPTEHKYSCTLYPYSTSILQRYKTHVRVHSSEKPFKCPECLFRAKQEVNIKRHLKHVHLPQNQSRSFLCPIPGCNYAAKSKGNLIRHSHIHCAEKSFFCSQPNCNYSTNEKRHLIEHTRVHTGEKPFVCQFEACSFATATQGNLVNHSRTHTKEQPYKCPEANCEYSAAQSSTLKQHRLTHEPKEGEDFPLFICSSCEYSCKSTALLSQHMKRHSLEKPFACSFESCEYRCKLKGDLPRHLKTHSEERQYKCELCPFRGKTRNAVSGHIKQVHCDPNVRPFKCTEPKCDYAAKTKGHLNVHLLIHKGEKKYSCSFLDCDFKSVRKSRVKLHEYNIHSEEKKEKCTICDFKCKTRSILLVHMRTHTKEEPYKCKEQNCEYRAKAVSLLKRHHKKYHLT